MEKRNEIHAVYAESLVFGSNFGLADVFAGSSGEEAGERAQSIPEAAYDRENRRTPGAMSLLIGDQFWPGF